MTHPPPHPILVAGSLTILAIATLLMGLAGWVEPPKIVYVLSDELARLDLTTVSSWTVNDLQHVQATIQREQQSARTIQEKMHRYLARNDGTKASDGRCLTFYDINCNPDEFQLFNEANTTYWQFMGYTHEGTTIPGGRADMLRVISHELTRRNRRDY